MTPQPRGKVSRKASNALAFERAAQYRDQLAKLKNVQSQQIVARATGDFDAVGLAEDHGLTNNRRSP